MQSQRYAQFSQGVTPFVVAAALIIGVVGGYAFRATTFQLAPIVVSTEASEQGHTVLVPRSVRESEAAGTILVPRTWREGDEPAAAPNETSPGSLMGWPEITR